MDRTRRAVLGLVLKYVGTVVSLAVALVTVPVILHWLGPTRFGAFRVSQEYMGYLALLEFGLGGVLMVGFARAFAARDLGETRRLIRYGTRAYLRFGILCAVGIIGFVFAAPWLVRIPEAARDEVIGGSGSGYCSEWSRSSGLPSPHSATSPKPNSGGMVQIGLILQRSRRPG